MQRKWWFKLAFLLFLVVISVMHVIPSMNPEMNLDNFPVKERVNLGLDLQGGLYMIMGIQFEEVYREDMKRSFTSMKDEMTKRGFTITKWDFLKDADPEDPQIEFNLSDGLRSEDFRVELKKDFSIFRILLQEGDKFIVGFSGYKRDLVREGTVNQSIEVIRNRIDEFGVSEPVITSHGDSKILIELPGVKDVSRAKSLIGQTAKLEFQIVADEEMAPAKLQALVDETVNANTDQFPEDLKLSAFVKRINNLLEGKLPKDTEVAFERIKDSVTNKVVGKQPYLLKTQVDVTGEDLQDAFVSVNQENNMPIVSLRFNFVGAEKFDRVTGANVRKRLAIVLDGVVHSAPVLQERISGGQAQITLGQGSYQESLKEAGDLAIVLRAGALPAQLEFQEQRVVGPSLGADSIAAGRKASLIACVLVLIFMVVYYRGSGLVANISLVLNTLFIFAILVGLEATLTLPGIAGIALTLGIAVDANVIIFERIREELRLGKSAAAAVELGFARALRTILDANITTGLAALVLMEFGTGPIRGFAVTLLIGIITTVFSAIFISRLLFDWWLRPGKEEAKFSI